MALASSSKARCSACWPAPRPGTPPGWRWPARRRPGRGGAAQLAGGATAVTGPGAGPGLTEQVIRGGISRGNIFRRASSTLPPCPMSASSRHQQQAKPAAPRKRWVSPLLRRILLLANAPPPAPPAAAMLYLGTIERPARRRPPRPGPRLLGWCHRRGLLTARTTMPCGGWKPSAVLRRLVDPSPDTPRPGCSTGPARRWPTAGCGKARAPPGDRTAAAAGTARRLLHHHRWGLYDRPLTRARPARQPLGCRGGHQPRCRSPSTGSPISGPAPRRRNCPWRWKGASPPISAAPRMAGCWSWGDLLLRHQSLGIVLLTLRGAGGGPAAVRDPRRSVLGNSAISLVLTVLLSLYLARPCPPISRRRGGGDAPGRGPRRERAQRGTARVRDRHPGAPPAGPARALWVRTPPMSASPPMLSVPIAEPR